MYEYPTQEQIDEFIAKAHAERALVMRQGLSWIGRKLASPFRAAQHFPHPRHH